MADGGVRPEDIEWNIDSLGATLVELYNNMSELIDMYEELRDRVYAVETVVGVIFLTRLRLLVCGTS